MGPLSIYHYFRSPRLGRLLRYGQAPLDKSRGGVLDEAIPRAVFLAKYVLFRETSTLSYNMFLMHVILVSVYWRKRWDQTNETYAPLLGGEKSVTPVGGRFTHRTVF